MSKNDQVFGENRPAGVGGSAGRPDGCGAIELFDLLSPDKRTEIRVRTANGIRFYVLLKGRALLEDCTASSGYTRGWEEQ